MTRPKFNFVFGPNPKVEPPEGREVGWTPVSTNNQGTLSIHTFAATVELDGKAKDVVGIAREMGAGVFEYRLSKDTTLGARFLDEPTGGSGSLYPFRRGRRHRGAQSTALGCDTQQCSHAVRAGPTIDRLGLQSGHLGFECRTGAIWAGRQGHDGVMRGLTNAVGIPVHGLAAGSAIRVNPAAPAGALPDVPYATTEVEFDAKERSISSNLLTDAMVGKSGRYNLLGLTPGWEPTEMITSTASSLDTVPKPPGVRHSARFP